MRPHLAPFWRQTNWHWDIHDQLFNRVSFVKNVHCRLGIAAVYCISSAAHTDQQVHIWTKLFSSAHRLTDVQKVTAHFNCAVRQCTRCACVSEMTDYNPTRGLPGINTSFAFLTFTLISSELYLKYTTGFNWLWIPDGLNTVSLHWDITYIFTSVPTKQSKGSLYYCVITSVAN